MAFPDVNDVQAVDPILQNLLVGYGQSETRFIADRAFPALSVDKDSGTYYIFTQKYWFTDNMQVRAPGGNYPRGDFGVETGTYVTKQYALSYPLADEVRANSQVPMDLETAAVRWLGSKGLINRERLWAATAMAASTWGASDGSVSTKWSTDTSDPVGDIRTGVRTISQATGQNANTIIMGEIVRDRLINHPDLIDRVKYTERAGLGSIDSALSAILGLNVLVGSAIYNSANEGQTASYSPIIDDDILILYVTPSPGIFEASAGYSINWAGGGGMGMMPPKFRLEGDADLIKYKHQLTHEIVASYVGYYVADVTD
jgi:hypothetical protein